MITRAIAIGDFIQIIQKSKMNYWVKPSPNVKSD